MRRFKVAGVFAVVWMWGVAATALADVIMDANHLNGSFSSPDVEGWQDATPPTGWSVSGSVGGQGVADGGVDAGQYLYWNAPSTTAQVDWVWQSNVYTIQAAGERLDMSYYVGSPNGQGVDVNIQGWMNILGDGYANLTKSGYVNCTNIPLGSTGSMQTLSYTTTSADIGKSLQIAFDLYSGGIVQANLDLVTVTTTPTPEPGTLVILVGGLTGLLCYAWRKRR